MERMRKTLDPVGEIREVLIAADDMVPVGEEPYVGWSLVLAERIADALGLDDLDAAVERMCRAYDADWYDGKDHTPEGENTWDILREVLEAALTATAEPQE